LNYAEFSDTNHLLRNSRMFSPPTFEEHSMGGLPHENNDIVAVRYDQPSIDEATLRSPAISARVLQNQTETEGILTRPEEVSNVEFEIPEMNSTIVRPTDSPPIEYEQHLSSDSISAVIYDDSRNYRRIPGIKTNYTSGSQLFCIRYHVTTISTTKLVYQIRANKIKKNKHNFKHNYPS